MPIHPKKTARMSTGGKVPRASPGASTVSRLPRPDPAGLYPVKLERPEPLEVPEAVPEAPETPETPEVPELPEALVVSSEDEPATPPLRDLPDTLVLEPNPQPNPEPLEPRSFSSLCGAIIGEREAEVAAERAAVEALVFARRLGRGTPGAPGTMRPGVLRPLHPKEEPGRAVSITITYKFGLERARLIRAKGSVPKGASAYIREEMRTVLSNLLEHASPEFTVEKHW
jgi:hypothetical protein